MVKRFPSRPAVAVLALLAALGTVVSAQQLRTLYVAVADAGGNPVLDLRTQEFQIIENGKPVPVERARLSRDPMRIALIVDSSEASSGGIVDIRAGLAAFINAIPEEHEIGFMTMGRQMRVRVPPDAERARVRQMAAEFAPDGGRPALLDAVREIDERFMRRLEDGRWPVFVIVTTDGPEGSGSMPRDRYVQLVQGMLLRGAIAHAVVVQGLSQTLKQDLASLQPASRAIGPNGVVQPPGPAQAMTSSVPERTPDAGEVSLNLTSNLRGSHQSLVTVSALTANLRTLAQRLVDDHRLMSTRYEVQYRGSQDLAVGAAARVSREGLQIGFSPRRPF